MRGRSSRAVELVCGWLIEQGLQRIEIRVLRDAAHAAGTTVVAAGHDPDLVAAADSALQLGL